MIHVQCPDCSAPFNVGDQLAGKVAKCRACGGRIPIPQPVINAGTPPERTTPTPIKSPSPKATPAPPAKSKPPAKPKPAPKKREEDFLDDDFEEVDELDEVEEFDDDDFQHRSHFVRTQKKRKKKSAHNGLGKQLASFAAALNSKMTPFLWTLLFCFIAGAVGTVVPVILGSGILVCLIGGCLMMTIASLRMIIVTFRVDTGWAIFFLLSGFIEIGIAAIGLIPIAALFNLFCFLMSIKLLIENWSDFRSAVNLAFSGFLLIILGPVVMFFGAIGGVAQQGEAMPQANTNPNVPPTLDAGGTGESFQIANIPIPEFENLSALRPLAQNATKLMYGQAATKPGKHPGSQMQFAYYEPVGTHLPRSLPCLIMANGGTTLMTGIDAPSPSNDPESPQYIAAGFAVLGISLDGKLPTLNKASLDQIRQSFSEFREAQAGLVNVRNGVEFLNQKVPQVDPNRLFVVGHSSAGTLALLAAAYEPRLKGCVAYCPASDGAALMGKILNDPRAEIAYPGITQFAKRVSPRSHVARMSCPIFLFHAADDQIVPVSDSRQLHLQLDSQGKRNTYVEVPTGAHDVAVVRQGIPSALQWLRPLAGLSSDASTPATQVTPTDIAKSTVPNGAGIPTLPAVAPANAASPGVPATGAPQPSGRAVTFRFQSFSGRGEPSAAARQALRNVSWADLSDIEIDQAAGEIRIGQLGGSVNTEPAWQAL